eukprot:TRINITY_DN4287_c0_g1_i2.p1 TRINITY_DN4287_c0_g1~~TRINITY_DN4287_c0_g1_i2.p1  ORF type:complete len:474 (+),score=32.49 TRINITY_DN4287_c0_g1_i2:53-1474(+)
MSFIRKIKKGNKTYLAEVENVKVDGRVQQRHIKYIGKEADGKTILSSSISNVEIDQVKLCGPLLILNHLAKEINLSSILGEYGDEILSLVFAHCIDYKSINKMGKWFERTDLNMILDLEDLTEARKQWYQRRVQQRHIKYIGKEADGKTILSSSISNVEIDQVKLCGPLLILNHLAKEINLSSILGEYGDEILSLVFAHCIDYKSINKMGKWFERTDLNMILDLEDLTEARLLAALDSLESQDATKLQKNIFTNIKKKYKIDDRGIVYDVTNTYLHGKKCVFGKLGKDKEGVKGRPLIQIGLGVTQMDGIPLFHKVFDGNIHDSRTLSDSLTSFKEYGIKNGLIIFDRGISSKENQKEIFNLSWKVLCGIPLNSDLKSLLKQMIDTHKFVDYKNRVKLNKTVFYVVSKRYSIGKVKGTIAFCYNEQLKNDIRESRFDEVTNAQKLLSEKKKKKKKKKKYSALIPLLPCFGKIL